MQNFLERVNAVAVGRGIGFAIGIAQTKETPDSPEAWVDFCLSAAREAHQAAMESPPRVTLGPVATLLLEIAEEEIDRDPPIDHKAAEAGAHNAARIAYRCCMPKLTGRRMTQAYIACVAAGVQYAYFSGAEATSLLYTAQLALAAYPHRRAKRG